MFPKIPGVEFCAIPNYRSGARNYAVSSDDKVWIGGGNKWQALETIDHVQLGKAVKLGNPDGVGARMRSVTGLLDEAFGGGLS